MANGVINNEIIEAFEGLGLNLADFYLKMVTMQGIIVQRRRDGKEFCVRC